MHYYEKTIVDAKDIYTDYLLMVLSAPLYEGVRSVYKKAHEKEVLYIEATQKDPSVKNPGVLSLFQYFLSGFEKMSDSMIEAETNRIKSASNCADIFDDLIKAVIKSHIIVLTFNSSGKKCKLVNEKMHEKIEIKNFIHKCYLECAKIFYDHPALFWHEFPNERLNENQRIIYQMIKVAIKNAIKKVLPIKEILAEYLSNDYESDKEEDKKDSYMKIKEMLMRDIHNNNNFDRKLFISSDKNEDFVGGNEEDNEEKLESLVLNRKDDKIENEFKNEIIKEQEQEELKQEQDQKIINLDENKSHKINESELFKKIGSNTRSRKDDRILNDAVNIIKGNKESLDSKKIEKNKESPVFLDSKKTGEIKESLDLKKTNQEQDNDEISIIKRSNYFDDN